MIGFLDIIPWKDQTNCKDNKSSDTDEEGDKPTQIDDEETTVHRICLATSNQPIGHVRHAFIRFLFNGTYLSLAGYVRRNLRAQEENDGEAKHDRCNGQSPP